MGPAPREPADEGGGVTDDELDDEARAAVASAVEELRADAERLVRRLYAAGTPERIGAELKRLARRSPLRARLRPRLVRLLRLVDREVRAELEAEFVEARTPGADRQLGRAFDRLLTRAVDQLAAGDRDMETEAARAAADAVREGRPVREAAQAVADRIGAKRHAAETVALTARAGYDRAARVEVATEAGVERFRYAGPEPERPFCRKHFGRVYTLAELDRLSNGHGLPVRDYLGGWRCRHRLAPVVD